MIQGNLETTGQFMVTVWFLWGIAINLIYEYVVQV